MVSIKPLVQREFDQQSRKSKRELGRFRLSFPLQIDRADLKGIHGELLNAGETIGRPNRGSDHQGHRGYDRWCAPASFVGDETARIYFAQIVEWVRLAGLGG